MDSTGLNELLHARRARAERRRVVLVMGKQPIDRILAVSGVAWQFRVGDRVKIRLVNEMDSDHPMHHPLHTHGAGRSLVLARDGEVEPNLVWSDTVLVRTGETVDTCWK